MPPERTETALSQRSTPQPIPRYPEALRRSTGDPSTTQRHRCPTSIDTPRCETCVQRDWRILVGQPPN